MPAALNSLHKSTAPVAPENLREKTAAHISFHLIYVNHGTRQPGAATGWRRLPGTLFETPQGGTWELHLRGRGSPWVVRPGDVLVVPTGVEHRLVFKSPAPGFTAYLLGRYLWMSGLDVIRLAKVPFVVPAGARLIPVIRRMAALSQQAATEITAVAHMQWAAFELLKEVLPYGRVQQFAVPDRATARILPVLRFIQDHPREAHSVTSLADYLDLSPTRFHALFKRAMGQAPVFYMHTVRCTLACQDLIQTNLTAKEISERCGFASPFYFSRLFRRVMGQSPLQFRRAFMNEKRALFEPMKRG